MGRFRHFEWGLHQSKRPSIVCCPCPLEGYWGDGRKPSSLCCAWKAEWSSDVRAVLASTSPISLTVCTSGGISASTESNPSVVSRSRWTSAFSPALTACFCMLYSNSALEVVMSVKTSRSRIHWLTLEDNCRPLCSSAGTRRKSVLVYSSVPGERTVKCLRGSSREQKKYLLAQSPPSSTLDISGRVLELSARSGSSLHTRPLGIAR